MPPPAETPPDSSAKSADQSPLSEVPTPGRDPRRLVAPKPKINLLRPPAVPQVSNPPVVSQQIAPLPPPIEIRPAPGVARPPRVRPPLMLMPPASN
jgi:large subunit ribosomal protein L24